MPKKNRRPRRESRPASARRASANRKNARKSTGPRTARGKSRAAANGLRHGLRSDRAFLPGESRPFYHAFLRTYAPLFDPATPVEHSVLRRLLDALWMWFRLLLAGHGVAGLIAEKPEEALEAFAADPASRVPTQREFSRAAGRIRRRFRDDLDRFYRLRAIRVDLERQAESWALEDAAAESDGGLETSEEAQEGVRPSDAKGPDPLLRDSVASLRSSMASLVPDSPSSPFPSPASSAFTTSGSNPPMALLVPSGTQSPASPSVESVAPLHSSMAPLVPSGVQSPASQTVESVAPLPASPMASLVPPEPIPDADEFLEALYWYWTLGYFAQAPELFPDEDRRLLALVVPFLKDCFCPAEYAFLVESLLPYAFYGPLPKSRDADSVNSAPAS